MSWTDACKRRLAWMDLLSLTDNQRQAEGLWGGVMWKKVHFLD